MPDQTTPLVRGFSVKDVVDPETIRDRALRLSGAVTAEQAAQNMAQLGRAMREAARSTRELEDAVSPNRDEATGLRADMLRSDQEETDRG